MLLLLLALLALRAQGLSLEPNQTHLFLDYEGIASTENVTVVLGVPQKSYVAPAVVSEYPWEKSLHFYTSALAVPAGMAGPSSPAEFRLYYSCFVSDGPMYLCLAVSSDGVGAWSKPLTGAFPFNGSATNRVFLVNASSPGSWPGSVFLDTRQGVPAEERFKFTYEGSGGVRQVYLATSPDGITWSRRDPEVPILPTRLFSDTQTAMVWDAQTGRYLVFGRADADLPGNSTEGCFGAYPSLRRVMLAVSNTSAQGPFSEPVQVLGPGAPDSSNCLDIYNPAPIAVPGAWLLLPSSYLHFAATQAVPPPPTPNTTVNDGILDIRLAASRDGTNYSFVSRDAFLERGVGYRMPGGGGGVGAGSFSAGDSDPDAGFVFATAGGLLDMELLGGGGGGGGGIPTHRLPTPPYPFYIPSSKVGLLYFGTQRTHGGSASSPGPFQGVLVASLRREGWAALRSPPNDPVGLGSFTTAPITVPNPAAVCGGGSGTSLDGGGVPQLWLLLNAATSVGGSVGVELLDGDTLAPLPNYSIPLPFTGNSVRWPAAWATTDTPLQPEMRDIGGLAGRSVAVRVTLRHAQLFAWEVQCVAAAAAAAAARPAAAPSTAPAALKPYVPCHMPYSAFTRATESPCFAKEGALGSGVTVRNYTAATDNGATLVSSSIFSSALPWDEALEVISNHMFDYFEGNGNAGGVNLTRYVTAPLMLRPGSDTRPWYVDMVLQPSAWPAKSHPPQPARGFVALAPFAPLQVAVLHRATKTPPAQADFEACDAALRAVVASSSSWTVNTLGAHTPTFAFYFPRDDGLIPTSGPYNIECWVEVSQK